MKLLCPSTLAALCALCAGAPALADPMPVHTATARVAARPNPAQRIAVADAVARVFSAALPDVLTATESHTRIQTLTPASLACAEADCATTIQSALGARAVVIVRMEIVPSHRLRLGIDVIDRRGQSLARAECEEPIGVWDDALALARVVAQPLAQRVRDTETAPTPTAPATPIEPTAPARVLAPTSASLPVVSAPSPVAPLSVTPPSAGAAQTPHPNDVPRERSRRPVEAAVGAALIAGGVTAVIFGLRSVLLDGSLASGVAPENAEIVYAASDRDYVLMGVGGAGAALGVGLLIDGLRLRTDASARVRAGLLALPGGALVGLHGAF